MIPIYSITSFLCVYFYKESVYYTLIGNCYEPFAIASFFTLLCEYIAPDVHTQKEYFRHIDPQNWVWPIPWVQKCSGGQKGPWRKPRSGLTWFNVRVFLYTRKYDQTITQSSINKLLLFV